MKKIFLIVFLILYLILGSSKYSYSAEGRCGNIEITRTVNNENINFPSDDNRIYPGDTDISLMIQIQGDVNPNNYYSYYVKRVNDSNNGGWIKAEQNGVNIGSTLGVRRDNNGYINLNVKPGNVYNKRNPGVQRDNDISLIPNLENPINWNDDDLIIQIIETQGEIPRLDASPENVVCEVQLKPTINCNEYENYYFAQGSNGFAMSFRNNNFIPPTNNENSFYFELKTPSLERNAADKRNATTNFSTPDLKIFALRNSGENSAFWGTDPTYIGSGKLILSYYNKAICQQPYLSLNKEYEQQLSQCKITAEVDNDLNYTGNIIIENTPTKILDSRQLDWLDTGKSTALPNGTIIYASPYVIALPLSDYNSLFTLQNQSQSPTLHPTNVSGIYSFDKNILSNDPLACFNDNQTNCFKINNNVKSNLNKNLTANEKYFFSIVYDVSGIGGQIAYKIPCQTVFEYTQGGKITTYPTPTAYPTIAYSADTPTPLPRNALCNAIKDPDEKSKCTTCIGNNEDNSSAQGVWTGIGCIETGISQFISRFFSIGLGLAGGIALLFFIYGGFLVLTSQGNAEQVQQGREIITSAIAGLLLIIFSVFILRLISIDILKLPGFETNDVCSESGGECSLSCDNNDKYTGVIILKNSSEDSDRLIQCKVDDQDALCCQLK
ncbi:hypothetical protein HYT02_02535 [Candidatus Gottesmanbacteria bacterium]|nr:hypothetical protein [Candidatus Gottesmanbacteria bacterium]